MKKIIFLVVILAGCGAFYLQTMPAPNLWLSALSIAVFMIGLFFLNQKATTNSTSDSDNQKDDK
jgi:hypothetical protein